MEPIVALDWGTTRVRAALINSTGDVVEMRVGESGVGQLDREGFEERFAEITKGWDAKLAIACGMIGSRQGWIEAAYIRCPAPLFDLSRQLVSVDTAQRQLMIVPGLSIQRATGSYDVMRGEETQLVGLLSRQPAFSGAVILPGTHSKWVLVRDGVVVDFLSYMTGDLYEAISRHTLLQHSIDHGRSEWNQASFLAGVDAALETDGSIWSRLFAIRADSLIDGSGEGAQAEFLSGLLIGSEFAAAKNDGFDIDEVVLIGGDKMISLYGSAAKAAGRETRSFIGTDLVWPALTAMAKKLEHIGD